MIAPSLRNREVARGSYILARLTTINPPGIPSLEGLMMLLSRILAEMLKGRCMDPVLNKWAILTKSIT